MSYARPVMFFGTIAIAAWLFNSCAKSVTRVDEIKTAERHAEEQAKIPDMIPMSTVKAIDQQAIDQAQKISTAKFCLALGKAIRTEKTPEYTRAMIQRASDEFSSTLKFQQQFTIKRHQIAIGFSPCMAVAAWGPPEKINTSVGTHGTHEQWVYPANYLYFENNTLTSYQSQS